MKIDVAQPLIKPRKSPAGICVFSVAGGWAVAVTIYAAIDAFLWPRAWLDWLLVDVFASLAMFPMFIVLGLMLAATHRLIPPDARFWHPVIAALAGAVLGSGLLWAAVFLVTGKNMLPLMSDSLGAYAGALIFGLGAWLRRGHAR